ncbi:MAG: MFS transporter [Nocardioidaceae bacterium]|nr:MFS transporter [Nocardioidaceae bacterium]
MGRVDVTQPLRLDSSAGRGVLAAAVLGSGMAMLDGTVVNVALRRIGHDLDASLSQLQWISNGYLLALASLILLGGSLGDRFGRRRVFVIGVVWFALASLLCGIAQTPEQLIVARVVQGIGAALLTPGSLAMIQGAIAPIDRPKAIGSWSGLGGIAAALGPFIGGWLVQYASWRWVFLLNLPVAVVTVAIARRCVPETQDPDALDSFDIAGAVLGAASLAGMTFALIESRTSPATLVMLAAAGGVLSAVAFVVVERRSNSPMMPTSLFASRQFSAANAMTLLVYAALGGVIFFLVLELQTVVGYGPLRAGLATLPITVVMLLLAKRGGALSSRIGPRLPMSLGPLVCAAGIGWLALVDASSTYWLDIFPGIFVFALGLALLVAPLTGTVLAAAPDRNAGIASGVNNALARAGSLLAVSALPAAVGLHGADYDRPAALSAGYQQAMWICVLLLVGGGLTSYALIRNPRPAQAATLRSGSAG